MFRCVHNVKCVHSVLVTKTVFIVHCVYWVCVRVFCTLSSVQSVNMYCLYVNCFCFCTVWSTLSRISLTKALVLWWCDNKSDLIWFDLNAVLCELFFNYYYYYWRILKTNAISWAPNQHVIFFLSFAIILIKCILKYVKIENFFF